ncbi:MAG TPA: undecaprenyl/decaprenyl-phosphate alpha-N-acetylglucosaminyl 1-phosphate transferase [Firmicutes bacterium]|nr:undecaprenyl/decaprenyl-phosphate alpha-N-acetylglucosaminyl 1-phosphate transferase [Bacillota bacterium]
MPGYVYPLLVAFSLTSLLTPLVRAAACRAGLLKLPCERSVHDLPVPNMGGLAMIAGFVSACLLYVKAESIAVVPILIGCLLSLLLGMLDDIRPLKAGTKFALQILIAVLAWHMGISIDFITRPGGGLILLGWLSLPITVLWIVSVMNVVNLIDGLDGLAAGIVAIACSALLIVALQAGQADAVLITASLAGCALGFLPYNFNPAKIFMGDTGSMFLGFALAAVSIEGTLKCATATALAVPVLTLGVPILDTGFALIRRVLNGKPIGQADKGHIHHQLLRKGFSQRSAVLTLYAASLLLAVGAIIVFRSSFVKGTLLTFCLSGSLIIGATKVGVLDFHEAGEKAKRSHQHR